MTDRGSRHTVRHSKGAFRIRGTCVATNCRVRRSPCYHQHVSRQEVLSRLRANRATLNERFGVARLTLFGSVARDQAAPGSDVDLLVEFNKPVGLFSFMELQNHLEALLGCSVDLGTLRSLKPRIRARVLAEAVDAA